MARDIIQEVNTAIAGSGASTALNEVGKHAAGYALPFVVPGKQRVRVQIGSEAVESSGAGTSQEVLSQASLTLRRADGRGYTFRIDPTISVSGKNVIAKRAVARGGDMGTVKEYWNSDDWSVTVNGVLIGEDEEDLNEQVAELVELAESGETLEVENKSLVDGAGVLQVVVESLSLPHTKGLKNQAYSLKLVSDYSAEILERK